MARRICVFGAGAIGGFVAAHLARSDGQLSVVARGAHLDAIRANGITIRRADGADRNERPHRASDDPHDLGPQDIVIVAVKSTSLPEVAARIAPLLTRETAVVFVGNGIPWWYAERDAPASPPASGETADLCRTLLDTVGTSRTIAGLAYCACTVTAPGVIHVAEHPNSIVLGELDGAASERVRMLAQLMTDGGLPCRISRDIRADIWIKLLTNLASGPICLLSRKSMRDSLLEPNVTAAAVSLVEEGMQIAAEALQRRLECRAEDIVASLRRLDHKPSILQDLETGRPLEMESLLTTPQMFARRHGVRTPMLDLLLALAMQASDAASNGAGAAAA